MACARQQGTTVSLANLFSTLPVRHKEFLQNSKRELVKLVHVLHGYCIISSGVRIVCTNQLEKGRKTTIVSTLGSQQMRDNITCVFGPKQVQQCIYELFSKLSDCRGRVVRMISGPFRGFDLK